VHGAGILWLQTTPAPHIELTDEAARVIRHVDAATIRVDRDRVSGAVDRQLRRRFGGQATVAGDVVLKDRAVGRGVEVASPGGHRQPPGIRRGDRAGLERSERSSRPDIELREHVGRWIGEVDGTVRCGSIRCRQRDQQRE
jgi:hypothetical protein